MSGEFATVPVKLLQDHRLTLIETRVAIAILSFGQDSCPTREQISGRCGYKVGTVSNATKGLVAKGWLVKVKTTFCGPTSYQVKTPEPHCTIEPHRISDNRQDDGVKPQKASKPACPHQKILDLYHEILPELQHHRVWTGARQANLKARWNESSKRQELDYWKRFFNYVRQSDFLMGRIEQNNRTPFIADLEWLVKAGNFAKVIEGKYHR